MARELAAELADFEIPDRGGADAFGAFRVGAHDDLVIALGLACLHAGISIYENRGLLQV